MNNPVLVEVLRGFCRPTPAALRLIRLFGLHCAIGTGLLSAQFGQPGRFGTWILDFGPALLGVTRH